MQVRNAGGVKGEMLTCSATTGCSCAMAKKGGADADEGASRGDGGGEISAHAHRELVERGTRFGGEGVAELAQGGERALGDGGIVG